MDLFSAKQTFRNSVPKAVIWYFHPGSRSALIRNFNIILLIVKLLFPGEEPGN